MNSKLIKNIAGIIKLYELCNRSANSKAFVYDLADLFEREDKRAMPCPRCKSTHTGINKVKSNYVLHCDESCGALWDTETNNRISLLRFNRQQFLKDCGVSSIE